MDQTWNWKIRQFNNHSTDHERLKTLSSKFWPSTTVYFCSHHFPSSDQSPDYPINLLSKGSSAPTPICLTSTEATPKPSSATVDNPQPTTNIANPSPTIAMFFSSVYSNCQWDKATVNNTLLPAIEAYGSDCNQDTTLVSAGMDLGTLQTTPLFLQLQPWYCL
jgi:hypothetical protein